MNSRKSGSRGAKIWLDPQGKECRTIAERFRRAASFLRPSCCARPAPSCCQYTPYQRLLANLTHPVLEKRRAVRKNKLVRFLGHIHVVRLYQLDLLTPILLVLGYVISEWRLFLVRQAMFCLFRKRRRAANIRARRRAAFKRGPCPVTSRWSGFG